MPGPGHYCGWTQARDGARRAAGCSPRHPRRGRGRGYGPQRLAVGPSCPHDPRAACRGPRERKPGGGPPAVPQAEARAAPTTRVISTGLQLLNRVAVYHSNRDLRIEVRDLPLIGSGELLLEVRASGICGSDVLEWYRRPRAPTVLGHEVAGQVVAVGEGVGRFRVGD